MFMLQTGQDGERERTHLWAEIFPEVQKDLAWIIVGDFNMVRSLQDQASGRPHEIAAREKRPWDHLERKMRWSDTFQRLPRQLHFSWCNRWTAGVLEGSDSIYPRLDHCYAPVDSTQINYKVVSKIMTLHLLQHLPM